MKWVVRTERWERLIPVALTLGIVCRRPGGSLVLGQSVWQLLRTML
jgi:hypothetical protein